MFAEGAYIAVLVVFLVLWWAGAALLVNGLWQNAPGTGRFAGCAMLQPAGVVTGATRDFQATRQFGDQAHIAQGRQ